MPVLQIALDLMQLKRAVVIAHEAVDGGADWVEVGTPLIKSEGAEAVRTLRREFPGKKIIADTKTMDVGGVEVEIMAKAGADIITVLGHLRIPRSRRPSWPEGNTAQRSWWT